LPKALFPPHLSSEPAVENTLSQCKTFIFPRTSIARGYWPQGEKMATIKVKPKVGPYGSNLHSIGVEVNIILDPAEFEEDWEKLHKRLNKEFTIRVTEKEVKLTPP
jgi:hypothetical protein